MNKLQTSLLSTLLLLGMAGIERGKVKKVITFLMLGCMSCASLIDAKTLEGSRPNIILVMTDDQGMGDLSCMGNRILKTPHLDRFYEQSTRFTDFQVSPTCAPTRSAIMSGRVPFKNSLLKHKPPINVRLSDFTAIDSI